MIRHLRQANLFMRSTAMLVVIAFTMMILTPTAMAARTELQQSSTSASAPVSAAIDDDDNAKLSKALQKVEKKMARLEKKLAKKLDVLTEINDLKTLRKQIEKLDKLVIKSFDKVKANIEKHNLPAVILQRHQQTVDQYRAEIARLLSELQAVEDAGDAVERSDNAKVLMRHLEGKKNKRSHQPFDPEQLPNRSLKPNPKNKPKETEQDFIQAGLYNTPYPTIAALGDFTFDKLADASNPAYLAETVEVTLSQAIKDKAAALNHDPVKIYHWVRNNVEWQPTWGAIQDADLTLSSQLGNAMDIASLTIALGCRN